jgi:hypothetical protein
MVRGIMMQILGFVIGAAGLVLLVIYAGLLIVAAPGAQSAFLLAMSALSFGLVLIGAFVNFTGKEMTK